MILSTDQIDLTLDSDGDLLIVAGDCPLVSGPPALLQAVRISILLGLAEWFLDLEAGTDWFGSILGKAYNQTKATATIRASIFAVNGIVSVDSVILVLNQTTRVLTISFRATGAFSDTVADTLAVQV